MNLLRQLHAWCGLVLALALALVGLTGAALAFRGEIVRASLAEARATPPPASTYGPALARFEREHPGLLHSLKFSPYGLGVHRAQLRDGRAGFIGPDGRLVSTWRKNGRFEEFALSVHHQLLAGRRGEMAVGLLALAALGMAVSGVVIWLSGPRRFGWRLWPRSMSRADLVAAHREMGLMLAILLLIPVPTGLAMVFYEPARALLRAEAQPAPPPAQTPASGARPDWPRIIAAAQAQDPAAKVVRAFTPDAPGQPHFVFLLPKGAINPEGSTTVYLDAQGQVLRTDATAGLNAGARLLNAALGVHSGAYGGLAGRALASLTGLALAAAGLMGVFSFLKRLARRAGA